MLGILNLIGVNARVQYRLAVDNKFPPWFGSFIEIANHLSKRSKTEHIEPTSAIWRHFVVCEPYARDPTRPVLFLVQNVDVRLFTVSVDVEDGSG